MDDDKRRPGDLSAPLPLGWANGLFPIARPVGSKTDGVVDLLFVRADVLQFVPIMVPHNFQAEYSNATHLRVTAIARGIDCESAPLRLTIVWDGKWERDEYAMAKHLVISAA